MPDRGAVQHVPGVQVRIDKNLDSDTTPTRKLDNDKFGRNLQQQCRFSPELSSVTSELASAMQLTRRASGRQPVVVLTILPLSSGLATSS